MKTPAKHIFMWMKSIVLLILFSPSVLFATNNLKVVSFNILAPCWASPSLYPASSLPLLDRAFRRERIIAFLQQQAPTTDIFALQETTLVELGYIKDAMKSGFDLYPAYHSPTYWSNWITVDPPWEPNGVALLVKKNLLTNVNFQDMPLSDDGNHSAYLVAKLKSNSQKIVRIASVHLDSDKSYNRERELNSLLQTMVPLNNSIDVIAGDFNFEITNGNLKNNLATAGFTDILTALGKDGYTSPYSTTYYKSSNWSDIDHVLVRNLTPIAGEIFSFNLYNIYPNDEEARINANLSICGSDHFPITGTAGN
ncbi:MAG: endonuclease/exonuclease/phosphatase family protein [Proteobacteria bacterium]|nr:endonuclease/exonuclease/phosphatase family protein [Pseudomonadota bacterium]